MEHLYDKTWHLDIKVLLMNVYENDPVFNLVYIEIIYYGVKERW